MIVYLYQLYVLGEIMKKTLYFISGTMGVGKTATSRILKDRLDKCVFLDGDWAGICRRFVLQPKQRN